MLELGRKLVLEPIPGTTGPRAQRAASLDHEPGDNPVECKVIIKAPL